MRFQKITAIVRCDTCERVEQCLREAGVEGFSITHIKGYGEYADFYNSDWLTSHARLEIFTKAERVERIVEAILNTAHVGLEGDGIIAVQSVDRLYRIRTRSEIVADEG